MSRPDRWLRRLTRGEALRPLVLLTALYFFDEFDTSAFNVLAPNIKRAFHLSDATFSTIVVLNLSIVLLAAIPASYAGDRGPRRLLVVVSGCAAAFFSLCTGLVGSMVLLLVVRIGNGVGNLSNTSVQPSLLADYHSPEARAGVFSIYQATPSLGAIVGGAVAGGLSSLFGWRAPFFIFLVPVVIVALLCSRLPEPVRGASDNPELAGAPPAPPPAFGEAFRTLWAVQTLRRQYVAYAFLGAGLIPLAFTLPLYFERVYHLGDFGRGLLTSLFSACYFLGTIVCGPLTARWVERGMGFTLRRAALFAGTVGVLTMGGAQAPDPLLSVALMAAAYFVAGMYLPPFFTVQSVVAPARVRTLAFGVGALFAVAGVVLLYLLLGVAAIGDHHGLRAGLTALGPYWIIASFILASAGRFAGTDAVAALRTLQIGAEPQDSEHPALLRCHDLDVSYDSVQVLFGVNFTVEEGEIVALLGTNGAGKSTLLKAVSGLQPPVAGSVVFQGRDITRMDPRDRFRLGVVQMPGGRSVFPTLTVEECLRLAQSTAPDPSQAEMARGEALGYFPNLGDRLGTLAGNLSGGEQQMLGLAMAFIGRPRLLMIDELSLGLSPVIVGTLLEVVRAIHARGTTIVVVEQSINVALTLAKRAVFLEKGEVRFSGATAELLDRPDVLRAAFLEGAAKRATAHAVVAEQAPDDNDRAEVLRLTDVSVRFGGIRAVDRVSLTVHDKQILGLIGANGAGKTTLFDAISGYVPSTGSIVMGSDEVVRWAPDSRARAGLGRSFQDARLFPSLTVMENLAVSFERHLEVRDPLSCALGLPALHQSEAQMAEQAHWLVELLNLHAYRNKFVGELSTGTRRMVDLGMAIAHRPRILLLDEPSSGIAQRETEALGPVLRDVHREIGCALLIIEHDMPLITSLADTLVALETGRVIATGTPSEVLANPRVIQSYLGDDEAAIFRSGTTAVGV